MLLTYQDLARTWQVNPKTVSRWIIRLERAGTIKPSRPTRNTVRLSDTDAALLKTCRVPAASKSHDN